MTYLCRVMGYAECPLTHGQCVDVCQLQPDPEREEPPEGDPPGVPG